MVWFGEQGLGTCVSESSRKLGNLSIYPVLWARLDWIGLDWIGLDWTIESQWIVDIVDALL